MRIQLSKEKDSTERISKGLHGILVVKKHSGTLVITLTRLDGSSISVTMYDFCTEEVFNMDDFVNFQFLSKDASIDYFLK